MSSSTVTGTASKSLEIVRAMVRAIEKRAIEKRTIEKRAIEKTQVMHSPVIRKCFPRRTSFSGQTVRSRLCFSVGALGGCSNQSCVHAHTLDEFQPPTCRHGNSCQLVSDDSNHFTNKDDENPCRFIHPSETIISFLLRNNQAYNLYPTNQGRVLSSYLRQE